MLLQALLYSSSTSLMYLWASGSFLNILRTFFANSSHPPLSEDVGQYPTDFPPPPMCTDQMANLLSQVRLHLILLPSVCATLQPTAAAACRQKLDLNL